MTWRSDEETPKDRAVIVQNNRGTFVVEWDDDMDWFAVYTGKDYWPLRGSHPTRWMEIPD